jgi:hypothetical protein
MKEKQDIKTNKFNAERQKRSNIMARFNEATFDNYFDLEGREWIETEGTHTGKIVHASNGITKNGSEFIALYAEDKDEKLCKIQLWLTMKTEAGTVTKLSQLGVSRADIMKCEELNQLAALVKHRAPSVVFETEKEVYIPFGESEEKEIIKYKAWSLQPPEKVEVNEEPFEFPVAVQTTLPVQTEKKEGFVEVDIDDDLPF